MAEKTDNELIQEYALQASEGAFAELVQRHLNLVYAVAFRLTGNSQDAQDAAQAVFSVLARKAGSLRQRATITGWLYETTRFTSARLVRDRARRQVREQEAYMQSPLNMPDADPLWPQLAPLLEEGMARLSAQDRALLALRFFENKTGAETASLLEIAEWAAHKRTARALEKLRAFFAKRGVSSTSTALAAVLSAHSVQAAPSGLVHIITTGALAGVAGGGGPAFTLAKGALKFMAWKKIETTAISLLVAALALYSVKQYNAQAALREEMEGLRQKLARLQTEKDDLASISARQARSLARQISPLPPKPVDLYDRLKDRDAKLKRAQLAGYLKTNGRNAASLLAAFRTSGDADLLKEAMEKFPGDPHVAFEACCTTKLSADDKRQWLDNFEKDAPDNALANYLSAMNFFNSGQTNLAVQDLTAAAGKTPDDYNVDRMQGDLEAYVAAGYPVAEAEEVAGSQMLLPQLSQVKQLALATVSLANSYNQAGDTASAQSLLQTTMTMGQQYADPSSPFLINQLVGIAVQKIALSAMDPTAPYDDSGATVQDQLNQLIQQRTEIRDLSIQVEPLMPLMSDQDWILYRQREMMFGEQNAGQWVVNQYGGQQGMP